jgi:hypothetical protein
MTPLAPPLESPLAPTAPLVAPLEALPPLAPPDELPLEGAPLAVAAPVLPPEPDRLTDPDAPDAVPAEPEAEPLPLEDPETTVPEGVFELEHARLVVTPTQHNAKRHAADMKNLRDTSLQDKAGGRTQRPAEQEQFKLPGSRAPAMRAP